MSYNLKVLAGLFSAGFISCCLAGGADRPAIASGLYVGLGGSWDSHALATNLNVTVNNAAPGNVFVNGSIDSVDQINSKFSPVVQIGYWAPFPCKLIWGLGANYKYLNYTTDGFLTGQALPASATIAVAAGGSFQTRTVFNNELLLSAYFGKQFNKGFAYVGLGALMVTVNAFAGPMTGTVIQPSGFSGFLNTSENLWGGAFQVGYAYYVKPTWFIESSYTFGMTGKYAFNYSTTVQQVFSNSGGNSNLLNVVHRVQFSTQEFLLSVNKVFQI